MASTFTKKNPKLRREMMVAVMVPYLLAALERVEAGTVNLDSQWISRDLRALWDRCVCLELPVTLTLLTSTHRHEVSFALRLYLRNDTQQMIEWVAKPNELSTTLERKAQGNVRRRLRRSREAKVRELAKDRRFSWGSLVAIDVSVSEFAELVRALTTEE